jgi:hypothetical protein
MDVNRPQLGLVYEIQADGMLEVLDFLAKAVGETGHAGHRHAH